MTFQNGRLTPGIHQKRERDVQGPNCQFNLMLKMVIYDSIAKTSKEISPAADVFHMISVKARVQLPGGLAVPGERRYWVSELMMRLFEYLKVLGRY